MQSRMTGLNNLFNHTTKTMMLLGHGIPLIVIITLNAGGDTNVYLYKGSLFAASQLFLGLKKYYIRIN